MKIKRILLGVAIGIVAVGGGIWVLIPTLGNVQPTLYRGQTLDYWTAQVNAIDVTASNQANAILNAEIIPQLTDEMFHDTNDSKIRMALIDTLNGLPGILIYYRAAPERRSGAAYDLRGFGPAAKGAIPALMQAVQSDDSAVHKAALKSLGAIHSKPEVVIPFLTKYLDDDTLDDEAATALGNFGSLARPVVPKIIPLLHAADDDAQVAAAEALKKIDPAAYTNATKTPYYVSGGSTPAAMNKSTANIKLIKQGEFDAEVVQSPLPVVVDFYATWCGPCKRLSPMLDELAGTLTNKIKFVKINVDEAPNLSQRFGIQTIPTLIFFKNGKVADKLIGLPSKDTLKTRLDSLAGPGSPAKNSG